MNKKNNPIVMFSIDSSTKKTGIAIWENGIYKDHYLIDYDEKSYDKTDPMKPLCAKMETRFPLMIHDIINLLNEYKPQIIYIEEEVVTRNMDTCRFLFRLQGVIHGWCLCNNCEFNTVRPTQWRKACGIQQGKGRNRNELKEQAIKYIRDQFHINVTDDEAESICIGIYALSLFE